MLGSTTAHQHSNPVFQLACRQQKAVLGRPLHRIAERADAAGNDGYFLDGIDAGQARSHEGMAHLVIGDPSALFLAEHPALLFDPGDDPLDRDREIIEADTSSALRLVAAMAASLIKLAISAPVKPVVRARDLVQIDILAEL